MATFTPTVFSVSIGGFDTAVLFNSVFQVNATDVVEFTDDDGVLDISDLGATTVKVGDDSQGSITDIQFRTITLQAGETIATYDVALISRADVADYLIVPIDRETGRIVETPLDLGSYAPGEIFMIDSVNLNPGVVVDPRPPVAVDDTVSVGEDGSVNLDLLSNDSDPDGDDISITSVGAASNGTVSLVDGTYVYRPDANFNGTDTFDYTISDGGLESTATVTVTVTAVNDAPVLANDAASTDEDTAVSIDVLDNDNDVDNDLSVSSFTQPDNGSVQVDETGQLRYTPNADFSGTDEFTYAVFDGLSTVAATVTVTVNPVNDAPVAGDDTASVDEDGSVTIDLSALVSDVDSANLTITPGDASDGGLVDNGDGTWTYAPDADFNGGDSFTYTVSDGELSDSGTISIDVNAVNDAPVAGDDTVSVDEDGSVTIDLGALVSDIDSTDLTITPGDASDGGLVDNGDGTWTYAPDADFNGGDSFTYTVSDGDLSDSGTISIDVNAVNDAPVAGDDTASADFETATTIDVLANDNDVENDNLTITAITGAALGTVEISADGKSIEYTPPSDFSGEDSFGYILSDGTATDDAAVTVTVGEPGNRAPVAVNDQAVVDEDSAVSISVTDNDDDADGDDISISDFSQGQNGSVGFDDQGDLLYTPNADYNGSDSFTYTISDGELSSTATVSVTVNSVNDAPIANDADATTEEDTSTLINFLALISDLESEVLDLEVGSPSNGVIEEVGNGVYRYTPDADFNGSDSVSFTVSDGTLVDQGMINITVEAVNDAPVAQDDSASTSFETAVDIDVLDNDSDAENDDLTITGITGAPTGQVDIAGDGKSVTYTPADGFSGDDSFGYILSDGTETDEAQVSVTVGEQEQLPPVANDDQGSTSEDQAVAIDVLDNDTDGNGDQLSIVSFTDGSSGSVSENAAGELVYTPDADTNGQDTFTYTITDGTTENSATVTVDVAAVNDPVIAVDDSGSTDFETGFTLNIVGNDQDVDGDFLEITGISGDPSGAIEISADRQSISYTPADGFSGDDTFTYTVTDGVVEDVATVTITVGEADNSAPIAANDEASTNEDTSVAIDVIDNDDDPDGDDISITGFSDGTSGTVAEDGEGQLVYTPNDDFNGTDSFTYTISDGLLESTATVDITVAAVNDAPEAGEVGPFATTEDAIAATYEVVAAAFDIDGDDLSIAAASASWSGGDLSVGITASGISFDPSQLGDELNDGDTAVVTVSYTLSDGSAAADGSFDIHVAGADEEVTGPNVIEGTAGSDLLIGTDADDALISLAGSYDRMSGGAGADTFVFGTEGSNGARERDLIMDFEVGVDSISLAVDDYTVQVLGSTGLITYGEDLIYVRGSTFTQEELSNSIQIGNFDDLVG